MRYPSGVLGRLVDLPVQGCRRNEPDQRGILGACKGLMRDPYGTLPGYPLAGPPAEGCCDIVPKLERDKRPFVILKILKCVGLLL